MISVEQTIISQYGSSPTLVQLVKNIDAYIDPTADLDTFYDYVWNVATAQGFGLDIWGRIVGVTRYIKTSALTVPDNFGFKQADMEPFNTSPMRAGLSVTDTYALADDAFRKLIYLKALYNITATNAPSLNQLLQNMFADRGRCYVNDLGSMGMRYTFEFDLTTDEITILTQSGTVPRPAGVIASVLHGESCFGFSQANMEPFNQAPFTPKEYYNVIS